MHMGKTPAAVRISPTEKQFASQVACFTQVVVVHEFAMSVGSFTDMGYSPLSCTLRESLRRPVADADAGAQGPSFRAFHRVLPTRVSK
jgi:hypothetical protein